MFEVTRGAGDPTIAVRATELPGGRAAPAEFGPALQVIEEISVRSVGSRVGIDGVVVADPEPSRCD